MGIVPARTRRRRRWVRPGRVAALTLAGVSLLIAACGSSSSGSHATSTPTVRAFAARGNAICSADTARTDALYENAKIPDRSTFNEKRNVALPAMIVAQIAALEPPPSKRVDYTQLVAASRRLQALDQEYARAVQRHSGPAALTGIARAAAPLDKSKDRLAGRLGFTACIAPGPPADGTYVAPAVKSLSRITLKVQHGILRASVARGVTTDCVPAGDRGYAGRFTSTPERLSDSAFAFFTVQRVAIQVYGAPGADLYDIRFVGVVRRKSARGAYYERLSEKTAAGKTVFTCQRRGITWTAVRR